MSAVNACESEARTKHDVDVAYCEPNRFRFKCNSKLPALFSFPPIIGSLAQVLVRQPHIPTVTLSNICTLITLFSHQRHVVLFCFLVHVKFSSSGRVENACLWVKTSLEEPRTWIGLIYFYFYFRYIATAVKSLVDLTGPCSTCQTNHRGLFKVAVDAARVIRVVSVVNES